MRLLDRSFYNSFSSVLIQFLTVMLFIWALGSIAYFSASMISSFKENPAVILSYLAGMFFNAVVVVILVNVVSGKRYLFRNIFLNHVSLSLPLFTYDFLIDYSYSNARGLEILFMDMTKVGGSAVAKAFFAFNLVIIANILLFFINREKSRARRITNQEYQLLELKESKTKAELEALQAKISPHFLYNCLNSITSLISVDPAKAEQMVILLSKFFRYSTTSTKHVSSLKEELEMVVTYLSVEKIRFEDRLMYTIYSDKGLDDYSIPRFLLQPLVENAIKHGISKIAKEALIEIKVIKSEDEVILTIHDNGPPFPDNFTTGYGLQSISDKLKLLYKEGASLKIENGSFKKIKIRLPLNNEFLHP